MTEIICASIAGICTIVCAIIGGVSAKYRKKSERRAELRQKENFLSLKMIDSCLQLSSVIAIKLLEGDEHLNGNVEQAKEAAMKAAEDYQRFMMDVTSYEISK